MEKKQDDDQIYFESLLKRVNLDKTELCTVGLKNLNRRLGHVEVHEKNFLMKKRRQLKNIESAQKTRQKAMSNINLLKSRVEILEDQLAAVKETQKTVQERNQAKENLWIENVEYWADKLNLINKKYMIVMGSTSNSGFPNAQNNLQNCQNLQNHLINFPKELDLVIRHMKKTTLEPQKFLSLEEPLDLTVTK